MKKWQKMQSNEILKGKGFFISYNPDTSATKCGLGDMINKLGGLMGQAVGKMIESDGRAETAIVKQVPNGRRKFYILNGDFRKEYTPLVSKGFGACFKFYKSKSAFKSGWSD